MPGAGASMLDVSDRNSQVMQAQPRLPGNQTVVQTLQPELSAMSKRDPRPESRPEALSDPGCQRGRLIAETGFDRVEVEVLGLMRQVFAVMARRRPEAAPEPEHYARALFGPLRGARLMAAVVQTVQVMSMSRTDPFPYANPFCRGCAARITPTEEHLIRVLHHLRRGKDGRAIVHALMLCDARPVARVIEAARAIDLELKAHSVARR